MPEIEKPKSHGTTRRSRLAAASASLTAVVALTTLPAASAQADTFSLNCTARTVSVRIADPGPADQTLWGELCYRGSTEPSTVQILVHGAGYNHAYWDFPVGNGYYSYVRAATAVGYATFDVDRIGVGNSSHPASSSVGVTAASVSLHDGITALRDGAVDGHAFSHVIIVGHSLGSYETWVEAASYQDVDAVIVTGALHGVNPAAPSTFFRLNSYPAVMDPKFADSGLDTGYLTTKPGTRESMMYNTATVDPTVVAADEANKDTDTLAEAQSAAPIFSLPPTQSYSYQIAVPVLSISGTDDFFHCPGVTQYDCNDTAAVKAFESQYYQPAAHAKIVMVPYTGHALALSTTAPVTDAVMLSFALSHLAP
jgi:pimeloyl-ACP methyl ester carboxylesterase